MLVKESFTLPNMKGDHNKNIFDMQQYLVNSKFELQYHMQEDSSKHFEDLSFFFFIPAIDAISLGFRKKNNNKDRNWLFLDAKGLQLPDTSVSFFLSIFFLSRLLLTEFNR